MKKELQNKLYEKFPKIFRQKDLSMKETAMCWGISCGDGWYNIIEVLCHNIQHLVDNPHKNIKMYSEWIEKEKEKDEPSNDTIERYVEYIEKEKKKIIPQLEAVQVKEKYGTLRFYLYGYPEQELIRNTVDAYISFAEDMSGVTCEECGSPGNTSGTHWIKTICQSCEEENAAERSRMIWESKQLKIDFSGGKDES